METFRVKSKTNQNDIGKSVEIHWSIQRQNSNVTSFIILVSIVEHSELRLPKISRLHMGDYLCVASNGIPPSTSKKYRIRVQCEFIHNKIELQ